MAGRVESLKRVISKREGLFVLEPFLHRRRLDHRDAEHLSLKRDILVKLPVSLVEANGRSALAPHSTRPADVIEMRVRVDEILHVDALGPKLREDPLRLIARIDDDGLARRLAGDDAAVALQWTDGKQAVDHLRNLSIPCTPWPVTNQRNSSLCVFCGSASGASPSFERSAKELGVLLAEQGIRLVYGGASIGLMGAVADAALAAGGRVAGVIPQSLVNWEIAHGGLTELIVVGSMHERKQRMFELSDAFVALPGGYGTLDEMFEMLTWAQLGEHRKPCALLNVEGFYDDLIRFLDHASENGFLRLQHRDFLRVATSARELVDVLEDRQAPLG